MIPIRDCGGLLVIHNLLASLCLLFFVLPMRTWLLTIGFLKIFELGGLGLFLPLIVQEVLSRGLV